MSTRVCLFAQYDPLRRVRPHVVDYVRALVAAGFQVAMACSGEFRPPESDLAPLRELDVRVLWRANAGLDFGAWRDLIRQGHAAGASAVLLANDSVFGPFGDLGRVVQRMRDRGYDAWGMVESWQWGWHLQSWFIYLTRKAFYAPRVQAIFDQPFETMTKDEIIEGGELALGQALRAERLKCGAASRRFGRSLIERIVGTNPSHLDWRSLLLSGRVPFVKAELIRDNAMAIPWADEWHDVISGRLGYDTESITRFLHDYTGSPDDRPGWFKPPQAVLPWNIFLRYLLLSADWRTAIRYAPVVARSRRDRVRRQRELPRELCRRTVVSS